MADSLIRLDRTTMAKMKRDVCVVFAEARHTYALEAVARGLGARSYGELREFAQEYGGILWDRSDAEAIRFLAERGVHVQTGGLGEIVRPHEIDHLAVLPFNV
jgi:hypothetical protein